MNLDGNGDGIIGDDYSGEFVVVGSAAATRVAVSDLTCGPGQELGDQLSLTLNITAIRN